MGRAVCKDFKVQREEKEKGSRYVYPRDLWLYHPPQLH